MNDADLIKWLMVEIASLRRDLDDATKNAEMWYTKFAEAEKKTARLREQSLRPNQNNSISEYQESEDLSNETL